MCQVAHCHLLELNLNKETKDFLSAGVGGKEGGNALAQGILTGGASYLTYWLGRGLTELGNAIDGKNRKADAFVDTDYNQVKDEKYGFDTSLISNTEVGQFAGGIAHSIGEMLPAIQVSGGFSKLGQYGQKVVSTGIMGVSSAGHSTNEARQQGATRGQAIGYGALSGAVEAGTEWIFPEGGVGGSNIGKSVKKSTVKELLNEMVQEGTEEVISELLNPILKKVTYDKDALDEYKTGDYWKGVALAGLSGAVSGGIMSGISEISNNRQFGRGAEVFENNETISDLSKQYDKTTDTETRAQIKEQINNLIETNGKIIEEMMTSEDAKVQKQARNMLDRLGLTKSVDNTVKKLVVSKENESKLKTTRLVNTDGTAKLYSTKNADYDNNVDGNSYYSSINLKETDRSDNGSFVYSKNPLNIKDVKSELSFEKVSSIFGIQNSLKKTYNLKLNNQENELSVLNYIAKRSGMNVNDVLEKLGYDSIVKKDGSVTIFNNKNILERNVKYGQIRTNSNSEIIKRNANDSTIQELQRYSQENGRKFESAKDQRNYTRLVRETLQYKESAVDVAGEKIKIKQINKSAYTSEMKEVEDMYHKIGVKTIFALDSIEKEFYGTEGFYSPNKGEIVLLLDNNYGDILSKVSKHEFVHAVLDKFFGYATTNIKDIVESYPDKAEFQKVYDRYNDIWGDEYSEDSMRDVYITEEIIADTYAGVDNMLNKEWCDKVVSEIDNLIKKGKAKATSEFYKSLLEDERYKRSSTALKKTDKLKNELIRDSANLHHESVYSIKDIRGVVNDVLKYVMDDIPTIEKIRIYDGKSKFIDTTFENINLKNDMDAVVKDIVDTIEKSKAYYKNGNGDLVAVEMSTYGQRSEIENRIKELVKNSGNKSTLTKWKEKYINTIRKYAQYVHNRAMLTSEYVTAIKNQKTLTKKFEDSRAIKIGGENVVNEITLYKNLTKGFLLSKSEKNIAPSSFTKLVNNFAEYTPENYQNYYDQTLSDLVDTLEESFEDGKFPDREPTLKEIQLFNAIRGRILTRVNQLTSEKHLEKIKKAMDGTIVANALAPTFADNKYGKLKGLLDTDIALPVFLRRYLGYDHPLVKHLTDTYFEVSSNRILKKSEFERFVLEGLSKEAGFNKKGALLKELNKKTIKLTDRYGNTFNATQNDIVGAYWTYLSAKEQLLKTGFNHYNEKTKTDMDFKFSDSDYQNMFSKMNSKVKQWADLVFKKYYNGVDYDYKSKIIEDYFGIKNMLEVHKGTYVNTQRVGQVNTGIGATSIYDAGYLSTMLQGFLKGRVNNKNHYKWNSATSMLQSNIDSVSSWGEQAQWVEDLRVMLNTTVPEAGNHTLEYYLEKFVPNWKSVWSPYLTKIALGKDIVEKKGGVIEKIGNIGQVSALGFNLLGSVPRQLLSDYAWFIDERVTFGMWLKTIPQAVSNFFRMGQIKQSLMESNGYFIERFNEGDVIKAIMNGNLPSTIGQVVLKPMEWLDSTVVSTHGYALAQQIVNQGIKNGTYEFKRGSKEYAQEVAHVLQGMTILTQSNSDPMFMSRLRSGDAGAIARDTMGRFHSDSQNKTQAMEEILVEKKASNKRLEIYENKAKDTSISEEERVFWKSQADKERYHFKAKFGKKLSSLIISLILQGFGAVFISQFKKWFTGREQWGYINQKETLRDAFLESTINWLPYVGTIANAIENNSDVSAFTVERLNRLIDCYKQVQTAIETKKENDIKKAIFNLVFNGLELTGVPANNIYQLFMGLWYQVDKEGSLTAQNWVKGLSSSYMKKQYTEYAKTGQTKLATAQLGAWSNIYGNSINDEKTLNELVRLSEAGYNATPSANAKTYVNEVGDTVKFNRAQVLAYNTAYEKVNKVIPELLKIEAYKTSDDESKANMIKKVYSYYADYAKSRALAQAPSGRIAKLLYYTNGDVDMARYILTMQELGSSATKEEKVKKINTLRGYTKQEKLLLAYLSGYNVSESNKTLLNGFLIKLGYDKKDI